MKKQGRFAHLFKGQRQDLIDEIQAEIDAKWDALLVRCEYTQKAAAETAEVTK